MTGPAHYAAAEQLIEHADDIPDPGGDGAPVVSQILSKAKVHAILALAAAVDTAGRMERATP